MTWGRRLLASLMQPPTPSSALYGKRTGLPSPSQSSPVGWRVYTRCGRLSVLSPDCPHPSSIVGKKFHTRRGRPRRPGAAPSTQHPPCTAGVSLWEKRAAVPILSFGAATQRS